jgi:MFS family permease
MTARRHLIDLRQLRSSRPFREIWSASVLTSMAGQMTAVAALAQVWAVTKSPIWTGAIGLVQGVPILVFGVLGGSLADRLDRRSIILVCTLVQSFIPVALTFQAMLTASSPSLVLALLAVQAATIATASPSRRTLPVRLLPSEQVTAALALQNLGFQASMLLGPVIGGVLIAFALPVGYVAQVLMMPVALLAAWRLPRLAPAHGPGAKVRRGGWGYSLRHPVLRGALLTDLATTALSMPIAIFPMINAQRLGNDPRMLGMFLSAVALGGILAGLLSGIVTHRSRPGLIQLLCTTI